MKISLKDKALIKEIRLRLPDMSEGYRYEVFKRIMEDYCEHCGDKHMPCYCMSDE